MLTETWLDSEQQEEEYTLQNYAVSLNSGGRGKGIASYFNNKFDHVQNIKTDGYSMSKISSRDLDVIGVYRSRLGDLQDIFTQLEDMIDDKKTTVIGGDFNICTLKAPNNLMTKKLKESHFDQIVKQATHIEGGLIDHLYIKKREGEDISVTVEVLPKYYSDHDCICVTLGQDK